ncbi:MAG: hypothetical protein Q8O67_08495 [Deltaproteobacteria bacterium]|nr:hypothetical protein [Deltaproteobacteria bacterium]
MRVGPRPAIVSPPAVLKPAVAVVVVDVAAAVLAPDVRARLERVLAFASRSLPPAQAQRVSNALQAASPAVTNAVLKLLSTLNDVAAPVLLRAVAARARLLGEPDRSARTLSVLTDFAKKLGKLDDAEVVRRSTVLDLDPNKSTSSFNPQQLWDTAGTVHDNRTADDVDDNDGLFQRFTGSCGPTALQMMLAEADPVFAFAVHESGLTSDATDDAVGRFQRSVLEVYGDGKALGRTEAWLRARVGNGLGQLKRDGSVDDDDAGALQRFLFKDGPRTPAAERALVALRDRYGFPDDDAVSRLRRVSLPRADSGLTAVELVTAMNALVSPVVGRAFTSTNPDGFARGQVHRHLDDVVSTLKSGVDVVFGTSEPGHWMLLSAVKGRKPAREFLVSDPDGGKTAWVTERAFLKGTFADEQFHIAKPGERPYVDCFILPVR